MAPRLLAFTGIAFLLTITPGADTMLVLRSTLTRGQRAGILASFGVCCGLFIHAGLSAAGLSLILVRSATVFTIVKWAGALYLIWLGAQGLWRGLRQRSHLAASIDRATTIRAASARRSFVEGLTTNLLNPKVAIFYLAFLPQFIGPGDPVFATSVLLAAIHFGMGMIWLALVALLLGRLRPWLTSARVQRWIDTITGAVLIAFGVRLMLERR